MKKLLALIALMMAMVLLLAACGQKEEGTSSAQNGSSGGVEGTWNMTGVKDMKTAGLSADELKDQQDRVNKQLKDGLVQQVMTFRNGKVTLTVKRDASVSPDGQARTSTLEGTYQVNGNKITVTLGGETTECKLNGNTLERVLTDFTAVFSRQ